MQSSTVLIVDDDKDTRYFLREALQEAGYNVVSAANAIEAFSELARQTIDLILLDLWLPGVDGETFLQRYHEQPGLHAPVLVITAGKVDEDSKAALLSAGILKKPFSLKEFYDCVEQLLQKNTPFKEHER